MCKEHFEKPVESSKVNFKDEDPLFDDFISTHENSSMRDSRKPLDVLQIEEEYNALTGYDIVLRRGRCGRYFTKYVQRQIFEDSETSDHDDDIEKKEIRKRKKKYQDL